MSKPQGITDALLRAAVRAAKVGLWEWELATGKVQFSPEWKQLLGYSADEIPDQFSEWEHRIHPDDLPRMKKLLNDYLAAPWPDYRAEFRMRHRNGDWRWILTQADVIPDAAGRPARMIGSHIDITEHKRIEYDLARANRALLMLSESNQTLIRAVDQAGLLQQVCRIAVEIGGYRMAWVGLAEDDRTGAIRPIAHAGFEAGYLTAWAEGSGGAGPAVTAIRTSAPVIVRNIPEEPAYGLQAEATQRGYQSTIALPLISEAWTIGVLSVYSGETDAFDREEVNILTELAGDLAFGITALRIRTDRDRAAEALRRTEADLQLALEAAQLGDWSWNIVTGEVRWSDRCKALYGLPADTAMTYQRFLEALHPEDRDRADAALTRAVESRSAYELEKRAVWPDGSIHWNISRGRVFCDASGQPERMAGVTLDITERKRAEESVRSAERRLSTLMESFPDMVSRFDNQGRFVYVSPSVLRATGAPLEAVLGKTPLEIGVSEDADSNTALQESLARAIASGEAERLEATFGTSVGPRHYEVRHIPERDERGQVISVLGIATDLTERKVAERQLYLLNYALDRIGEGIYLMEGDSPRFVYVNQSAADSLGYAREELTGGMGVFDIDPEWTPERWAQFLPEIKRQKRMTIESSHRTRDGRVIPVEITGNYFTFEGQDFDMAVVRDVSERKAAVTALRESETMYRSLVTAMAEGVVFQDASGRITAVNPAAEQIQGRTAREMLGLTSDSPGWGAIHEDGTPFPGEDHPSMATLRTGIPQSNVIMGILRPDGARRWISINSAPLMGPGNDRPYAVVTTFHDITDRRMAEEAVRARELEYRTLADNTPDFIVRWDRDLNRVYLNPAFAAAVGAPATELVGRPFGSLYTPAAKAALGKTLGPFGELIRGVFRSGEAAEAEMPWHTVEGPRVFLTRMVPERVADGTITTVLGIGRDITALKDTERQLRTLTEHSPDIILRFDREGRYLYANHGLEALTGVPAREHIGRRLGEVTGIRPSGASPEVYQGLRRRIGEVASTGHGLETEVLLPLADGAHVFNVRLIPEADEAGVVASVLTVARDVTEQKHAEAALRASEQRFRQVTETIDEVFWLTDATKNEMIYVSPAYERVFGRTCAALYGAPRSWLETVHPEDRSRVEAALPLQATGAYDIEYRIVLGSGSVRWIHDRAFPIRDAQGRTYRIAGVAEDVTLRRELEDQLRQSQKMEAVGQLAGGIAHDFNNMLAVIQMQSTLLLESGSDSTETKEGLREILAATERATNLTRQLLTFSRRQVKQPTDLDISETISGTTKLLRRILGEDITLETRFAASLPLIHADPGMIEQVLMNLAINARDAMPSGGRLSVTLDPVLIDEQKAQLHPGAGPGRYVCLSVSDTGSGIPAAALPRIFEPFFTTKDVGRGTGLGLATVFGIVEQHHGWIDVQSALGVGTTFKVYLPALDLAGQREPKPVSEPEIRGGTETVLLVEDEAAVRTITRAVLERLGYQVLEAGSAAEALAVWESRDRPIHLLLTDLIMPGGVSGRQLAEQLMARDAQLRVIYATGYSPDVVNRLLPLDPARVLLQKPYGRAELAEKIRHCLDRQARSGGT